MCKEKTKNLVNISALDFSQKEIQGRKRIGYECAKKAFGVKFISV